MKSLNLNQMSEIQGGSDTKDFVSGLVCAYGIFTITTVIGAVMAVAGCATFFDWQRAPIEPIEPIKAIDDNIFNEI